MRKPEKRTISLEYKPVSTGEKHALAALFAALEEVRQTETQKQPMIRREQYNEQSA